MDIPDIAGKECNYFYHMGFSDLSVVIHDVPTMFLLLGMVCEKLDLLNDDDETETYVRQQVCQLASSIYS